MNGRTDTIMDAAAVTQGRKAVLVACRSEIEAIGGTLARTGISDVEQAIPDVLERLAAVTRSLVSLFPVVAEEGPAEGADAVEVVPDDPSHPRLDPDSDPADLSEAVAKEAPDPTPEPVFGGPAPELTATPVLPPASPESAPTGRKPRKP